METSAEPLEVGDWIRFQVKSTRIVLEGFIQEISPDEKSIKIGHAAYLPEGDWYLLTEIDILHRQFH